MNYIINKELWNQFLGGKIGVRCDTREQYDRLMQECERAGVKWNSGTPLLNFRPDNIDQGKPETFRLYGLGMVYNITERDSAIPFPSLFLDAWKAFVDGKCYLRVTKDEWPEFAKRCEAAGIKWCWGVPVREIGSALHGNDGPIYAFMDKRGLNSYGPEATCTTNKPIHPFSALSQPKPAPEPEKPAPKFKVGDICEVTENSAFFRTGNIVRITREANASGCVEATLVPDGHNNDPIHHTRLKPYVAPSQPAPYDGRGKHKVGDRFEVIGTSTFNIGDIIKLVYDDGTHNPKFERITDGAKAYKSWCLLKPLPAPVSFPRIEITTDGRVTTATLYEGDKAVKTGKATCSPEDKYDFMEGATIAYNRMRFGQDFNSPSFGEFRRLAQKIVGLSDEIKRVVGE